MQVIKYRFWKFLECKLNNTKFFFKVFKNKKYIKDRELRFEKDSGLSDTEKKRVRRKIDRWRTREGERARATNVSRIYTPFVPSEHASLARRNSRGTVREIGPITARPPCGSFDPRREQYARASRFIAERLVNKAPILFFSARLAVRTL